MRLARFATLIVATPLAAVTAQPSRPSDIERAFLASAQQIRWPGFEPERIPLAVYDGQFTALFRHPAPPAEFVRSDSASRGAVMAGRHPAVTANSSAQIGGRGTATLMTDLRETGRRNTRASSPPAASLAAIALHEAFHVFQRERHVGWVGNEGDLFTYPVDDARRLALRRLETDALHRAQEAGSATRAVCWARAFLQLRTARYDGLDSAFTRYERLTELNEGLANYIQTLANGQRRVPFPAHEFSPSAVRLRTYTTGTAIALLLDRVSPGWQALLESQDQYTLDQLLTEALVHTPASANTCAHSRREHTVALRVAQHDSVAIAASRRARRRTFDARSGLRLVVEANDAAPLWPQGFDPLNVERVNGGLLHTRFLSLGNDAGTIELIDEEAANVEAVTAAAGAHPLFTGVRHLSAAGFRSPEVRARGDSVTIVAKGLKLTLRGATLRRSRDSLIVTLSKSKTGSAEY